MPDTVAAELGTGPTVAVLFGLTIPALGALVRWWMGGMQRANEALSARVEALSALVSRLEREIALLDRDARHTAEEIKTLRRRHGDDE